MAITSFLNVGAKSRGVGPILIEEVRRFLHYPATGQRDVVPALIGPTQF